MKNSSRRLCAHLLKASGGALIVASLVAAIALPPTGMAYADAGDAPDAAPAAILLEEALENASGNDLPEDATVAHVVPQVRTVIENGPLAGCEFSLGLYDANGEELDEATNDSEGDVSFSQLSFTADDMDTDGQTGKPIATTFTYSISELPQDQRLYVYDESVIQLSIVLTPGEDGAIQADVAYGRSLGNGSSEPIDDPTFTNRFNTVAIHQVVREREEPHDPLAGVHCGLWMVNPNGDDWYLGQGRNQREVEGSELGSGDNGYLWWDVPVISYACYYFIEEWPPPAGRLVDPFPSDYFQLVFDDNNNYQIVYESDPEFLPPYGYVRLGNNVGKSATTGSGGSAGGNAASDNPSDSSAGNSPTSNSPANATTQAQQPTVAVQNRTSVQKLPATSDMAGGYPALLLVVGTLSLLASFMLQRYASSGGCS